MNDLICEGDPVFLTHPRLLFPLGSTRGYRAKKWFAREGSSKKGVFGQVIFKNSDTPSTWLF